jgi:hypothetical protein
VGPARPPPAQLGAAHDRHHEARHHEAVTTKLPSVSDDDRLSCPLSCPDPPHPSADVPALGNPQKMDSQ